MTGPHRQRDWSVPDPQVQTGDLDSRLLEGVGRTGLLQTLIDHDTPGIGRCPRCGWAATTTRRFCPTRQVAKALIEHKPLPAWLAHLTDAVPGALSEQSKAQSLEEQRAAEDELPGLFESPVRSPERKR